MRTLPLALALAMVAPAAPLELLDDGEIPGSRIPIARERRYEMSGAVRPLLFWIGRDDIGLARIVWRKDSTGARGYELLVGTDPARAPRALNRWGFISEEATGNDGALLALMTGSHETSYKDEAATATGAPAAGDFRVILSRVQGGSMDWRLARVRTPQALTVHDVARAVDSVEQQSSVAATRRRAVAPAVRPGFLVAVADLLDAAVGAAVHPSQAAALGATRIQYVFGEQTYELRVRRIERQLQDLRVGQAQAVKTVFETRTLATGERSEFIIVVGTTGETTGVPFQIEWQPRWWLKVRLTLRES